MMRPACISWNLFVGVLGSNARTVAAVTIGRFRLDCAAVTAVGSKIPSKQDPFSNRAA